MNEIELQVSEFLASHSVEFDARVEQKAVLCPGEQLPVELAGLSQDVILLLADLTKASRVSQHDILMAIGHRRLDVSENAIYVLLKHAWNFDLKLKLRKRFCCSITRGTRMASFDYFKHYENKSLTTSAELLHCIICDASAMDETFSSWCDIFGYDSDSINALKTYNACIDNGRKLADIFTPNELDQLRELLQGY
jgi:hypothetical protein